jgi:hypothetical protein
VIAPNYSLISCQEIEPKYLFFIII